MVRLLWRKNWQAATRDREGSVCLRDCVSNLHAVLESLYALVRVAACNLSQMTQFIKAVAECIWQAGPSPAIQRVHIQPDAPAIASQCWSVVF